MEKSIGLSSQFAFALLLIAALSASTVARGDAKSAQQQQVMQNKQSKQIKQGSQTKQKPATSSKSLPESKFLQQNDDVLPTQNRTQAMAIEAENGRLPTGEETELKRKGFAQQAAVEIKH